jgi:drug/metabolite transporter (DMT)-like permease
MPSVKAVQYAHLHLIVFIWGFTAVLGALISIEAIPLVWYRMGVASVLMWGYLLARRQRLRFGARTLLAFAVAGLIIALHWITFFGAVKLANVSVTLAIMSTGAFFTAFLEPILFGRKIVAYEVLLGLIVVAGLYLIFDIDPAYTTGILMALASAFLGALFNVINGKLVQRYQASTISFYELAFGALFITVFLAVRGELDASIFELTSSDALYLFLLASVCTAYAFIAAVHVMKWLSPYTVSLTINMEPVYGILLALILLGDNEHMGTQFYIGAGIILFTVLLNGFLKLNKKRKRAGNQPS